MIMSLSYIYMIIELSHTLIVAYTYLIDASQKFLRKYASVSNGRCYSGVLPLDKIIITILEDCSTCVKQQKMLEYFMLLCCKVTVVIFSMYWLIYSSRTVTKFNINTTILYNSNLYDATFISFCIACMSLVNFVKTYQFLTS